MITVLSNCVSSDNFLRQRFILIGGRRALGNLKASLLDTVHLGLLLRTISVHGALAVKKNRVWQHRAKIVIG